jgi:gluconolactonase
MSHRFAVFGGAIGIWFAVASLALVPLAGQAPAAQGPAAAAPLPPCLPAPQPAAPAGGGGGRGPAGGGRGPAQPQGPQDVTVAAIPGVVAAGAKWAKVWQTGGNNADGVVADKDGNLLAAGEDSSSVVKIDAADRFSVLMSGTKGGGSLALDRQGRMFAVLREPQPGNPNASDPTFKAGIAMLAPQHKILADAFADGSKLSGRPNDLAADGRGGAYFTQGSCVYYAGADGKISAAADNIRTNGIVFNPDNSILYVTDGAAPGSGVPGTVAAFDAKGAGTLTNRRVFAKLDGGNGDGMAMDSTGRLYVTAGATVQVFDKDGKHLGTIPTPRNVISVGFAGADRKTLYIVGNGAEDASGQPVREGVQQTGRTIYKLPMTAAGLKDRGK